MDIERKRKELEFKRVELSKQELEFKIIERLEEIKRLEDHIKTQDEKIEQLKKDLGL